MYQDIDYLQECNQHCSGTHNSGTHYSGTEIAHFCTTDSDDMLMSGAKK